MKVKVRVKKVLTRLRNPKLRRRQVKRRLALLRRHGIIATPPARWDGVTLDIKRLVKIGRPTNEVTLDSWMIDGRTYRWERSRSDRRVGQLRVI